MRVRFLKMDAGVSFVRRRGEEYDLPDAEAMRLMDAGRVELVLPPGNDDGGRGWPFAGIGPRTYLQRFPTGPNADLARHCLVETR